MSLHREINFENEICEHLSSSGWLHAEDDNKRYNRPLALFPDDVLAWFQETDPGAWEALTKNHGSSAAETVLKRLRDSINQVGTLEVLRHGFDVMGLRKKVRMAQFKPAFDINPEITKRYQQNRLRLVRQLHYSTQNENSIDLALFLNGIPVATIELKTDNTQSVEDAVDQYRHDRNPSPKGQASEPLLTFNSGALVHFAVSNSEVRMTTKLTGASTRFLPFNLGYDGAAGNPPNPNGHKTSYLWEDVWEREGWLEIIGRYMVAEQNDKKQVSAIIFPRFHQLDATRKLQQAVLEEGAGQKYLIQHSAGSGKTNSIAWSAHFLADLHDSKNKKLFDTVIVVSDRRVIDGQLQDAINAFERTAGVVTTIKGDSGSKSAALAEALSGNTKVVVCTIQTFPFALEAVRELAATEGKRFAVIADEAHSSQSGQAAAKLKQILSAEQIKEIEDGGSVSSEDILAAEMKSRASDKGITFVAFTATPKAKTLELFGRRPDPLTPASESNLPQPFHVYSMRQAIEEGFILDVLKNYTSYNLAFKLANGGKELDDKEVERSAATKRLMSWVRLHPYNIAQKVHIVVEHFRVTVAPLLDGKAKAMVVVGSRKEAVRWKIAIDKYVREQGYALGSLVAFSGEVDDKESGPEPFKETSKELNPNLKGRDIREAFKEDQYQILLVANKFQTGFDQPLLCGMYVDKRLDGIQAVQTLSRLNRCYPGKEDTYVLDFVNEPEGVLEAFSAYYTTAVLSDVTDPDIVLDLRSKLDATGYYDEHEVERVVAVELNPKAKQSQLQKAIEPVSDRLIRRFTAAKIAFTEATEAKDEKAAQAAKDTMDALILFRTDANTYLRAYSFLSQVFDYGNTDFEKRAIFFRYLVRLLKFGREREGVDLTEVRLTHHSLRNRGQQNLHLSDEDVPTLQPITEAGSGEVRDKEKERLSAIIERVNDLFDGDLTDSDQLVYVDNVILGKMLESKTLVQQASSNTKEQFSASPDLHSELMSAIMDAFDAHSDMSKQALNSETVQIGLLSILLNQSGLYEKLRGLGKVA